MDLSALRSKIKRQDIFFVVFIISALVLGLWRCSFGFGGGDESFYYALAHRIYQGDALFKDEWHLSQMSGIFLVPFVQIYERLTGSAEGIMYAGRIMYVLIHFFVVLYAYKKLRKYGYLIVFAGISYFIFAPNEILAYYYNTVALDGILLCGIIMAENREEKIYKSCLAGIFFSCAVLCCPYLAIAFVLFWITVLLTNKKGKKGVYSLREAVGFTLGVVISAAVFLIFLFSRTGLRDILINYNYMFQDGEHTKLPALMYLRRMIYYYTGLSTVPDNFALSLVAFAVFTLILYIDKGKGKRKFLYLCISVMLSVWTLIMFRKTISGMFLNMVMLPMAYIGMCAYMLIENKPKRLFYSLYLVGCIHAIVLQFSSNQYFFVLAMAVSTSGVAGFVFLSILFREITEENPGLITKTLKMLTLVLIVGILSIQVYTKLNHCYWEDESPLTGLKYEINVGPGKNIRTDEKKYDFYMSVAEDLNYYSDKTPGKLLVYDEKIWPYLYLDKFECAAYSAWLAGYGNAEGIGHLLDYYRLNPEKIPEYVYVIKDNEEGLEEKLEELSGKYGYEIIENDRSWKLEKID